jgi:TRAP-type C4-dicarboxylate transport system permease small subunit
VIERLDRVLRGVERVLDVLIAALVIGLVAIVASSLVDRHFVTLPIPAPDQYARVLLVWLTFIGFALAVKNGANIRVDLIDSHLPRPVRTVLEVVFELAMMTLAALIAWHGWRLVEIGRDQERLGTVISEAWPAIALFASCLLTIAFLVLRLALRLTGRPVPQASHVDVD